MAASSCESNVTSIGDSLSESFDISGGLSVAVERCPLCAGARRPFYCATCVNKGLFSDSKETDGEKYIDKYEKWNVLKKERLTELERTRTILHKKCIIDRKKIELEECKENICLLKLALVAEKDALVKDKKLLNMQKIENNDRRERMKYHSEKRAKICKRKTEIKAKLEKGHEQLKRQFNKLVSERKSQISILMQYVFPISEIHLNTDTDMVQSTVSALKDARQTAYVKGYWVYGDKTGEVQYQIVNPTLPANGDFSLYHLSVEAKSEDGSAPDTEPSHRNPAHTISAAHCYTAQLVSILSYILCVHLPRKLCYSDFCIGDLNKKQFNSAVGRLNQNILHLCLSQGVSPDKLFPMRHLQNIQQLLNSTRVGRENSFEASSYMQSVENSYDSDDNTSLSEDDQDAYFDWEPVPHELPEVEISGQMTINAPAVAASMPAGAPTGQLTAGSLMSSVASIWRAATSHFDRR